MVWLTSVDQLCVLAEDMTAGLVHISVGECLDLDVPGVIARDGRVGSVGETGPALVRVAEQNWLCWGPVDAGVCDAPRTRWLVPLVNSFRLDCEVLRQCPFF